MIEEDGPPPPTSPQRFNGTDDDSLFHVDSNVLMQNILSKIEGEDNPTVYFGQSFTSEEEKEHHRYQNDHPHRHLHHHFEQDTHLLHSPQLNSQSASTTSTLQLPRINTISSPLQTSSSHSSRSPSPVKWSDHHLMKRKRNSLGAVSTTIPSPHSHTHSHSSKNYRGDGEHFAFDELLGGDVNQHSKQTTHHNLGLTTRGSSLQRISLSNHRTIGEHIYQHNSNTDQPKHQKCYSDNEDTNGAVHVPYPVGILSGQTSVKTTSQRESCGSFTLLSPPPSRPKIGNNKSSATQTKNTSQWERRERDTFPRKESMINSMAANTFNKSYKVGHLQDDSKPQPSRNIATTGFSDATTNLLTTARRLNQTFMHRKKKEELRLHENKIKNQRRISERNHEKAKKQRDHRKHKAVLSKYQDQSIICEVKRLQEKEEKLRSRVLRNKKKQWEEQRMKALKRAALEKKKKLLRNATRDAQVAQAVKRTRELDRRNRLQSANRVKSGQALQQMAERSMEEKSRRKSSTTWHGKQLYPSINTSMPLRYRTSMFDSPGPNQECLTEQKLHASQVDKRYWKHLGGEGVRETLEDQLEETWDDVGEVVRRVSEFQLRILPSTASLSSTTVPEEDNEDATKENKEQGKEKEEEVEREEQKNERREGQEEQEGDATLSTNHLC
eukprot:m.102721 g.102721  ORF g.102721 m.102721 type:complete len:667 (+) comp12599_c0_seq1:216-2216(+)